MGNIEQSVTYLYLSSWAPPLALVPTVTHAKINCHLAANGIICLKTSILIPVDMV